MIISIIYYISIVTLNEKQKVLFLYVNNSENINV